MDRNKPTEAEVIEAFQKVFRWIGDDPSREGLGKTPSRILRSYKELFSGYERDPAAELRKMVTPVKGYSDLVLLKDLAFYSHCEHHMMIFSGFAQIAYFPDQNFVGISKLGKLLDIVSRRLQTQERMTVQIAEIMEEVLAPKGTAVIISATHGCMSKRGVKKQESKTVTTKMTGLFLSDPVLQKRLFSLIQN